MARVCLAGPMQSYPVRPGHAAKIDFRMIFEAAFGSFDDDGEWLKGGYGTMPRIWARQDGKKAVVVDTDTDKSLALRLAQGDLQAAELAKETQRSWNDFLEGVTGYDAKQRSKKIQEQAKKDR